MSDPLFTITYTVDLDYQSPHYPSKLTIVDGINLKTNKVVFYCKELDALKEADPDLYYNYCIYKTLSDNGIHPKTENYLPMVKDRLNFEIDDFRLSCDVDESEGIVKYKNDLQSIFNNHNNIYLGSCPTVKYGGKIYSLLPISLKHRPLPDSVLQYVKDICSRARQSGVKLPELLEQIIS
jgi:hypothetical protein